MLYLNLEQYMRLDAPTLLEIGLTGGSDPQAWLNNLNRAAGSGHDTIEEFISDLQSYQQDLLLQLKNDSGEDDLAADLEFRYKLTVLILSTLDHNIRRFSALWSRQVLGKLDDAAN